MELYYYSRYTPLQSGQVKTIVFIKKGDRGSTVVKVLCYKSEGRWFDPFRSHYGPGVDSTSNRNEYQEHILGVKAAGA
jgi:hypothetical protein